MSFLFTDWKVVLPYASWYLGSDEQALLEHAEDTSQKSEEPVSSATRKLMLPSETTV